VLSGSPTITTPVIAQINDANGNETLKLASIASAVNEVTIQNAATGNPVHIRASGGDASVGLHLVAKGASGYVNVTDGVDETKRLMFNAAGGTTNTRTMLSSTQTVDRTLSLPDATDTLVGKATTDTLTNKTLTSPTITSGILNGTLGATTPSSVAATTGTFSSTLGVSGDTTLGQGGTAAVNMKAFFNGSSGTGRGPELFFQRNSVSVGEIGTESAFTGNTSDNLVIQSVAGSIKFYNSTTNIGTFTSTGLNSTAIGQTTAAAGSFTTLKASGMAVNATPSSLGTTQNWLEFANTGGDLYFGQESSVAGAFFSGSSAYATVIYSPQPVQTIIGGTKRLDVTSAGAAITGTLSATGAVSANAGTFVTDSAGAIMGIGGTSTNNARLVINGSSANLYGSYITFQRNSVNKWSIGTESGISGTNSDAWYMYDSMAGSAALKFTTGVGLAVTGALSCTGALSKGSGSFRIEHPLPSKSATHQLVHSFIEGPKCDLIYRGKINLVDGKASVNIDTVATMTEGTFEVLCGDVQCFTSNESGWGAIRGKVTGNILTIEAQDAASTDNVSWMVIGERKDKHIMDTDWTDDNGRPIVEPLKPAVAALESK
jgi:hypothetical protein